MPAKLSVSGSLFDSMGGLKFLKLYKHSQDMDSRLQLISNVSSTFGKLRLLHWDAYSLITLPTVFPMYYLVELILRYSNLETFWDEKPVDLGRLKRLDLTGSKNLWKLSDISSAIQLEEVTMEGCTALEQIPDSIGSLPSLKKLNLSKCDGLRSNAIVLKESIDLQQRSHIDSRHVVLEFPASGETLIFLTDLSVEGEICISLSSLRGKAGHLSFSNEQHIPDELMLMSNFYSFRTLNIMRSNYSKRGALFTCYSFSDFPFLRELNLVNLNMLVIPDDIHQLVSLEKLDLSGNDFKNLPMTMRKLSELKYVRLCNCRKLKASPSLPQVEILILSYCLNLQSFMELSAEEDLSKYSLLDLSLGNCKSIESLSAQLHHFTNLRGLDLSGHEFESVPMGVKDLPSLLTLSLNNCKKLKSLTELPLSLKCLYAHGCKSLETVSISKKHSLNNVDLVYCFRLKLDAHLAHLITQLQIHTSNEVSLQCGCLYQPRKSFLVTYRLQIWDTIMHLSFAATVMVLLFNLFFLSVIFLRNL